MANKKKSDKEATFIRKLCMQLTPEMVGVLYEVAMDKNEKGSSRVSAANSLLDRGWGKPKSTDEVEREASSASLMSPELERVLIDTMKVMVGQSSLMRAQGNSRAQQIIEGEYHEVKELLELSHDGHGHGDGKESTESSTNTEDKS